MVFSSLSFIFLFLPPVLLVYYLIPAKARMYFLLAVSLFFYGWGEPVYLIVMLASILINWAIGWGMSHFPKRKKQLLILALVLDIGMLVVFKYSRFFMENLQALFPPLQALPLPPYRLPIGISFLTFQILSYVIDLYRGKVALQSNPFLFGAYISMFPQLVAGPVVRYADIEATLYKQELSLSRFAKGIGLFIIGLGKKLLLANAMGELFTYLSLDGTTSGVVGTWVALLAYTFQIYFDFSGYSDMACGPGEMLGFSFMKNFDYPYQPASIKEFWRRWHISLSSWFKEYVYIPLGGNHKGLPR